MEVVFLGTGSMVPTKERNHQSIFISHNGEGLLIDCGEGTQRQLKIADIRPGRISKIFITHWHGDHVLGLPGLLQTLGTSDYDRKLEIYGPEGTKERLEHLFKAFSFNIEFEHSIKEIKNTELKFRDFSVISRELEHGMPCLGYRIEEKDKRRIKTNVIKKLGIPDGPLLGKLQENKPVRWKGKIVSPKDTTYVVEGKKIAVVLDTMLCNGVYDLAQDADLLISEASFTSDLENKAEEYKHMTARQAATAASRSGVKELILTHLSQRYKTPENVLEEAKTVFRDVRIAHDFMKIRP
ncbi:Ribonuclease Z [archaeon GW2011_AR15]|nr:Ribonuclease Z [archaeon GW2011_AR15]MBS3103909.1 ribonuclease Z [Candidatus Woesearchaeota archaeon]